MKYIFSFLLSIFIFFQVFAQTHIDVYYLSANAYCPSVEMIENEAKSVLSEYYKEELENKTIQEKHLNIMEDSSKNFTSKWEIYTNGLILLVEKDTLTFKVDLNDFAFTNIPARPNEFKQGLKTTIDGLLENNK